MKNKFKDRFKEPSTYAALSSIILGLGVLTKVNEAPAVADAVAQSGAAFTQGEYIAGGAFLFSALAGIFLRERK